ncbi:MAG: hypothetical protein IIA87_05555 [Nanoarchaeota archaeon]|nr:hypothetical protein [Nanoarchaeota archaeon]
MGRLMFDDEGNLAGVEGMETPIPRISPENRRLITSASLEFLKEDKKIGNIFSKDYWSLYEDDTALKPIKFSNGKTQEDVVKEIVELSKEHKVIFLHGTCGSGKSAIALNVARVLGKASIVVPVKALQRQYEEDYITKKHLKNLNGKKMKIAMITGKDNHDSLIQPGVSCADPNLPENIKITERNYKQLREYVKENPFISKPENFTLKNMRRVSIAPSNPYWSPILPAEFELKILTDSKKRTYRSSNGKDYIFYHRKRGCSYYDQYLAYMDADVIIFNSAKYKSELSIGRKPLTEVDIIDEADEFLDSYFQQEELNITWLLSSLKNIFPDSELARDSLDTIRDLLELEEKNKRALGVEEDKVFHISETKLKEVLEEFASNAELEAEIILDELNYSNKALETAKNFKSFINDLYLTYRKDDEGNLYAKLVSTNLSGKFQALIDNTKTLILMSGTLHSENIIKNIFGIKDFQVVQAESLNFGSTEIIRTGKEFDCKYANFSSKKYTREDYLKSLSSCIEKAENPTLVHVNSFQDLPTEREKISLNLGNLKSSERLRELQYEDKTGKAISDFKKGISSHLFTTKCSRGVDFPGEICNSIIFTKYPNPNVSDTFWKILQKTHPTHYWEFYKDKARREFLQRIYRALRSPDDHVKILSPDLRVLDAVRKLQEQ